MRMDNQENEVKRQEEDDSLDSDDDYQSKRLKIDEESDEKSNENKEDGCVINTNTTNETNLNTNEANLVNEQVEQSSTQSTSPPLTATEAQKVPPLKIICNKKDSGGSGNYILKDNPSTDDANSPSSSTESKQPDDEAQKSSTKIKNDSKFPKRENTKQIKTQNEQSSIKRKLRSHTRQQKESSQDDEPNVVEQSQNDCEANEQQNQPQIQSIPQQKTPSTTNTTGKKRKQKGPILPEPPEYPLNDNSNDSLESNSNSVYVKKDYGNNCIKQFIEIRGTIDKKREKLFNEKREILMPKNINEFYLYRKNYLIANNNEAHLAIPFYTVPSDISDELKELYTKQERERYNLRIRHRVEQDKLVILYEHEVLRCFNLNSKSRSHISFCSILNDNEVYTMTQASNNQLETTNEQNLIDIKHSLDELAGKFQKRKDDMIKRHLNESDSLYAVQKMEWQTKLKSIPSVKMFNSQQTNEINVPIVSVNSKFELTSVKI